MSSLRRDAAAGPLRTGPPRRLVRPRHGRPVDGRAKGLRRDCRRAPSGRPAPRHPAGVARGGPSNLQARGDLWNGVIDNLSRRGPSETAALRTGATLPYGLPRLFFASRVVREGKSETRNPKSEINHKFEARNPKQTPNLKLQTSNSKLETGGTQLRRRRSQRRASGRRSSRPNDPHGAPVLPPRP